MAKPIRPSLTSMAATDTSECAWSGSSSAMTDLPKKYDPSSDEKKWYSYWEENGYFYSEPDEREPYAVVILPPNVTGVLHMGHTLTNTIQEVLVRRARMLGKTVCWARANDHASIALQPKRV